MPRAGGVYTLPAGNPVVTLTVISSNWANTTMSDIATALTGSLPTDGSAPMAGALRLVDGTQAAPGLTFGSETTSGLYRIGAGDFGFSVAAAKVLEITGTVFSAPNLNVLGATIPANGVYLSAANTLAFATASTQRGTINATGNWVINAPTAGVALSVAGFAGANLAVLGGLSVATAGNVTIAAPTSGNALTITGVAGTDALKVIGSASAGNSFGLLVTAGINAADIGFRVLNQAASVAYFQVFGDGGVVLSSPAGGDQGLGTLNATGLFVNGGPVYSGIPQNLQIGATYTLVLSDAGKSVTQGAVGAHTYTIPANSSVAFPIGTAITIINEFGAGAMTLNITTDTLTFSPGGATGARTLAAGAIATIIKITATAWYITGTGIT